MQGALDASQRETAQLAALLETLHAHAPVGFGFVDRELRMVRLNAALAALNGATVEAHLGRDRRVARDVGDPRARPELLP